MKDLHTGPLTSLPAPNFTVAHHIGVVLDQCCASWLLCIFRSSNEQNLYIIYVNNSQIPKSERMQVSAETSTVRGFAFCASSVVTGVAKF